ncbi:hypothetical protein EHQ47_16950 [Leptospira bourretii]|uniref:hypothetical protein n=1 Tax=Leptospira bourretii TaxID=2484962 RepID=UPI001090B9A3|nr:hypothetical protein [Leptospira bourretii]TGL19785.1 hypothetical protein EHQ47_16950 [Leptospira bourretii]
MKIKTIILLTLAFESCRTIPIYKYEIEDSKNKVNLSNKSLKILFLDDARVGVNIDNSILSLIPLFIYGKKELHFPEYDEISVNSPLKYFIADILEKEIGSKFSLKKILITDDKSIPTDFTIQGVLQKSFCERRFYTYGLSLYGVLLWYFGAPAMANECEIELKIAFLDSRNKEFFSKIYSTKQNMNVGIYTKYSNLNRNYSETIKFISKQIIEDINSKINN